MISVTVNLREISLFETKKTQTNHHAANFAIKVHIHRNSI